MAGREMTGPAQARRRASGKSVRPGTSLPLRSAPDHGCTAPRKPVPGDAATWPRSVMGPESEAMTSNDTLRAPHPYVGMWVTADGFIRQELLPNGRYDEARGRRRSAYTGRYTVSGNHIDYVDDTGFTATGDVRDGVLFHEHLVLYREGDHRIRREGTGSRG